MERVAQDERLRVAGGEQPLDVGRPRVPVQRDRHRPDPSNRQVGHAPLGGVLGEEADVIPRPEAGRPEEPRGPLDALPEIGVGDPLFPSAPGDAHGHPAGVVPGARLEQLNDRFVLIDPPGAAALLAFERGKDPFLEPGKVDVEPVVVPVDLLRVEVEPAVVAVEAGEQVAGVIGPENEALPGDEGPEGVVVPLALADEVVEPPHLGPQMVHGGHQRPERLAGGAVERVLEPPAPSGAST